VATSSAALRPMEMRRSDAIWLLFVDDEAERADVDAMSMYMN
jgi:hypothetical protein